MAVNRDYILDMLKSKTTTIDRFNYDKLSCPPILSMFSYQDINNLHSIATSLRYSAKPEVKFNEIDKIMRSRGFVKLVAGTNRVCYRCVEDTSFVVKVAYNDVGLKDNPAEFRNQFNLKPFCTKVFECTPDGTLATFERVDGVTSPEEFYSMSDEIFDVLNEWILGEYIMEDVGTNFFLNWGCRKGFGPVILDFSYLYKLDGNKLFCCAPNKQSPTGCCDGEIDYDDGFNFIYCKRCGVRYRATELAEDIKESKIIIKGTGEKKKMKVRIKGGDNNVDYTVNVGGEYAGLEKTLPKNKSLKKAKEEEKTVLPRKIPKSELTSKINVKGIEFRINNDLEKPIAHFEKIVEDKEPIVAEDEVVTPVVEEEAIETEEVEIDDTIDNNVDEESEVYVKIPEVYDVENLDDVDAEYDFAFADDEEEKPTREVISPISFSAVGSAESNKVANYANDILNILTMSVSSNSDDLKDSIEAFVELVTKATEIIGRKFTATQLTSIIEKLFVALDMEIAVSIEDKDDKYVSCAEILYAEDGSDELSSVYYEYRDVEKPDVSSTLADTDNKENTYNGYFKVYGETVDLKSIFHDYDSRKFIVLHDAKTGKFMVNKDNKILTVVSIDDVDVADGEYVSKIVVDALKKDNDDLRMAVEAAMNVTKPQSVAESTKQIIDGVEVETHIPTGALPASEMFVNGVKSEG